MLFAEEFFLDVKKIHLVHKFTLDRINRGGYPLGRGCYGLAYVLGGRAEYRFLTGERITVTDGDALFLSPDAAYSIITENAFEHYTVNFDIHEDTSKSSFLQKPYCLVSSEKNENIRRAFIKLTSVWMSKTTGFEMRAIGCLYELLSIFYFDYINRESSPSYQRLLSAKEYIEQNFNRNITLEELAKMSDMSVTNFRREWKKLYAEAPLQYRDTIRLNCAKEYLNSGYYYKISEIAKKCGFDDASYFVRFFKKQTGLTPCEFKKQI